MKQDEQSTHGPGPPAWTGKQPPSIEPVVLMIFVHTKYVNKIKYLCSATSGPGLCPLSRTLQPLCFRSDLFCVSPSAALVCSPIFFTRTRSRQQIYKISLLTPLSLTLMWIKVTAVFPRDVCVWRFRFGEEISRGLLETCVLFSVLLLTNLDKLLASWGLCFLCSKMGILN